MNLVEELLARVRGLLRRGREDDETTAELRFHLEMETAKNVLAGMTPAEARRQALRLGAGCHSGGGPRACGGRPLEDSTCGYARISPFAIGFERHHLHRLGYCFRTSRA